ncbi:MAG: type II toxin-antitoxin system Phd/YefM family antitoxin [Acidobacteria bacterium]|nr:type II toxin-antitoxin system Phd/YefM family antitoxin [Acidobacteriota bacterium]
MVKKVTALEARHKLGELLEGAYHRGDQFVIERAGKPMAAVVPLTLLPDYDQLEAELTEGLEDVRKGRIYGPFDSAAATAHSLRQPTRRGRARKTAKKR